MARIPDDELERLKREVDLVALVRSRGVELKEHGRDMLDLCPLHEDHSPSLVVSPFAPGQTPPTILSEVLPRLGLPVQRTFSRGESRGLGAEERKRAGA